MSEKELSDNIRVRLHLDGWHTEKSHGNAYQSGWPDLYCMHPEHGQCWIETKVRGKKLEASQVTTFLKWHKHRVRIYIITSVDDLILVYKHKPPNWPEYYAMYGSYGKRIPNKFGVRHLKKEWHKDK